MKQTKSMRNALSMEYDISMYKRKITYSTFKRFCDIIFSLTFLILFSWLYLILIICVKCTSKGPAFYGHERIGKNGKKFKLWKFRSMKCDNRPLEEIFTPEQMEEYKREFKVTNDPRITKFGKFLRKFSFDELPQIWDIFVGRISVVGPRPPLQCEVEKYNEYQSHRLDVKGGLLCLWQIQKNRHQISFDEWVDLDIKYVETRSVWLDIKIICLGFFRVLFDHSGE